MDKVLEHKTDWKLGETVKPDDFNRLEGNDKELASQLDQMLLDMLKKDGSVEMIDTLRLVGDWIGVRIANANGDRGFINISPRINGEVGLQLGVGNVDDTALDYPLIVTKDGVAPNTANNKSLGKLSIPWKDVWVGGVNNTPNGYCKLTNSMVVQWGQVTQMKGSTQYSLNLPVAFPNSILSITGSSGMAERAFDANSISIHPDYTNGTTLRSKFRIASSGASASNFQAWWIAIGY